MNKHIETKKKRSIGKGTKRTSQENEFFSWATLIVFSLD
jgi:hypothetical protein